MYNIYCVSIILFNPCVSVYIYTQGGSYLCGPVHGPALHGDQRTAGCEERMNFADESICLMAGNVLNYGK
jgi:hypothetical protein